MPRLTLARWIPLVSILLLSLALATPMPTAVAESSPSASSMKPLQPGPDGVYRFGPCHARLDGTLLTIGNAHLERVWLLNSDGMLHAVSFHDLPTGKEWFDGKAPGKNNGVQCELTAVSGQAGPTEEASLQITLITHNQSGTFKTRFQVFAASSGILMDRTVTPGAHTTDPSALSSFNRLESFPFSDQWELTRVKFLDQTDRQSGPLVIETPCRESDPEFGPDFDATKIARRFFRGNLFYIEDPKSYSGLLFLKHAPLPDMRPSAQAHPKQKMADMTHSFNGNAINVVSFDADEITSAGGTTYRWVTLAYSGGRAGRIAALQRHHRQLRKYDPARDGLLLTNTWGDRSADGRVSEEFMKKEIAAAGRLGVDVVEIDDGWQKGATANSVNKGGVWNGFYAKDANFWSAHPGRFPHDIKPLAGLAASKGMQFGLWFAPDSSDDFKNWRKDRDLVLGMHRERGVNYFKFDGIKMHSRAGEANVHQLVNSIIEGSGGRVTIDLDVTAEVRPGYFGIPSHGPIFVENRYTESGSPDPDKSTRGYWPHKTLRNFWLLAQYVDPARLRMEFLNNSRNTAKYGDHPLAPANYQPDYLFAAVMFASPLGWFETQHLPPAYFEKVAPLVKVRKEHRAAIFGGSIIPVGEVPSGAAWTGFVSVAPDRKSAYALVFRELTDRASHVFELPLLKQGKYEARVLAGSGEAKVENGKLSVRLAQPRQYVLLRLTSGEQP